MVENIFRNVFFLGFAVSYCYCSVGQGFYRSPALSSIEECKVGEPMLMEIAEILDAGYKLAEFPIGELNDTILGGNHIQNQDKVSSTLEGCYEIISNIDQLTVNTTSEIIMLYRAAIVNPPQYEKLLASIKSQINNLNSALISIKYGLDPGMETFWEKVEEIKSYLFYELNNRILEAERANNIDTKIINLITSQIMLGEYANAENNLKTFNDQKVRDLVTDTLYKNNSLDQLAGYIKSLPKFIYRMLAILRWYYVTEETGGLSTTKVIVLRRILLEEVSKMETNVAPELTSIMSNVEGNYSLLTTLWASKVQNASFDDIIEFGSPRTTTFTGETFDSVIPDILSKAYSSSEELNNCLNFVLALRWNKHKATGFEKMYNLVTTQTQQELRLAHKMKLAMDNLTGPDNSTLALTRLNTLKGKFGDSLRCIVWFKNIKLQSVFDDLEYLYVANEEHDIGNRNKRVLTSVVEGAREESGFEFIYDETSADNRYLISNHYYNNYLGRHSYNWNLDDERGYVSLRKDTDLWKVEFNTGSHAHIRIIHVDTGKYLFASEDLYNPQSRGVYLWLPGGRARSDTWWVTC